MTIINPDTYGNLLMLRIHEATKVRKISVKVGDWVPKRNQCHQNVSYFCEHNQEYFPVRGWIYFALEGLIFSKLLSHSVVCGPDGIYYDITPWEATEHYPFIASGLKEEDYAELVEVKGFNELHPMKNQN
jgi:hypothetical protein